MLRKLWPRKDRLLVLGDSHANVFRHWRIRIFLPRTKFQFCIVGGATVSGLDNPNSQTQAIHHFSDALASTSATVIITLLGEVDTGFVIWYRAQKYRQSVDEMLNLAISNYDSLLYSCSQRAPVIVVSAALPTIQDGQDWGEVANQRKVVTASLRERTELTLEFNRRMAHTAAKRDCGFMSLDEHCVGANGTVDARLLNSNSLDHHYSPSAYARLIGAHLPPLLQNAARERARIKSAASLEICRTTECQA